MADDEKKFAFGIGHTKPLEETHPHLKSFAEFLGEFNKETPRGAALAAAAFLDDLLERILGAFLIPNDSGFNLTNGFNAPLQHDRARTHDAAGIPARRFDLCCDGLLGLHLCPSNQRDKAALCIRIAVDVPLRGFERSVSRQQLDITQRAAGLVNDSCGPRDEGATTRVRGAPFETSRSICGRKPHYDADWSHRATAAL